MTTYTFTAKTTETYTPQPGEIMLAIGSDIRQPWQETCPPEALETIRLDWEQRYNAVSQNGAIAVEATPV